MKVRTLFRHRPRAAALVASLLVIIGALALAGTRPMLADSHEISIVDFEFQPATLTVFVGEPVTWANNSSRDHTVTSDEGTELDGNPIGPGEAYGHVFETPGTYGYHCEIHGDRMTGTIVVEAAPATPTQEGTPEPTPPPGTLPPNFSPFPDTSSPPSVAPTGSPTPGQDGTSGDESPLGILLVVAAIVAVGGGAALWMRRRNQP